MSEKNPRRAISLDLDGVVLHGRIPFQINTFLRVLLHGKKAFAPYYIFPYMNRRVTDEEFKSLKSKANFWYHAYRKVRQKDIVFFQKYSDKNDLYGNTGRNSTKPYIEATEAKLIEGGVRNYLKSIYYKPQGVRTSEKRVFRTKEFLKTHNKIAYLKTVFSKPNGVSSVESKAVAIIELLKTHQKVVHIDDDPGTVFPLAEMFPNVEFIVVQDFSTGILFSVAERNKYPNVHRVVSLTDPNLDSFLNS